MNQPYPGPQRPPPRSRAGCALLVAVLLMVLVMPTAFILPVVAPQPTCNLLAPILGCEGGETPSCSRVGQKLRRGTSYTIDVECPEGGGSSAPIWIVSGSIGGATLVFFFIALGITLSGRSARRRNLTL